MLGLSPLYARIHIMEHCLKIYILYWKFRNFVSGTVDFETNTSKEKRQIQNDLRAEERKEFKVSFKCKICCTLMFSIMKENMILAINFIYF